jgi:hypothetical protein
MKKPEYEAGLVAGSKTATSLLDDKLKDAGYLARSYSSTIHEWMNAILPAVIQDAMQAGEDWRKAQEKPHGTP